MQEPGKRIYTHVSSKKIFKVLSGASLEMKKKKYIYIYILHGIAVFAKVDGKFKYDDVQELE